MSKENDVVVNCRYGSSFVSYTIIALKRVDPIGKVISIEPDPDNFDILNRNINLNKFKNALAVNYVVYSKEEQSTILVQRRRTVILHKILYRCVRHSPW